MPETKEYKINSLSEIFRKIEEYDNKETLIKVYAVICQLEKKDENNYTLLLQDIRNSFNLNINPAFYLAHQESLVVHNELLFTLKVGVKQGKVNHLTCEKIGNNN